MYVCFLAEDVYQGKFFMKKASLKSLVREINIVNLYAPLKGFRKAILKPYSNIEQGYECGMIISEETAIKVVDIKIEFGIIL